MSTKILKSPPQEKSDTLGHVYRHGVEEKDAYLRVRCKELFGPSYDEEDDDCNNAQTWGSQEHGPDYLRKPDY